MKTIEEGAKENLSYERDFLGRNPSDNMVCRAYQQGRHDAIEETLEWWSKKMREVNYETYDEVINAFRKAMEE